MSGHYAYQGYGQPPYAHSHQPPHPSAFHPYQPAPQPGYFPPPSAPYGPQAYGSYNPHQGHFAADSQRTPNKRFKGHGSHRPPESNFPPAPHVPPPPQAVSPSAYPGPSYPHGQYHYPPADPAGYAYATPPPPVPSFGQPTSFVPPPPGWNGSVPPPPPQFQAQPFQMQPSATPFQPQQPPRPYGQQSSAYQQHSSFDRRPSHDRKRKPASVGSPNVDTPNVVTSATSKKWINPDRAKAENGDKPRDDGTRRMSQPGAGSPSTALPNGLPPKPVRQDEYSATNLHGTTRGYPESPQTGSSPPSKLKRKASESIDPKGVAAIYDEEIWLPGQDTEDWFYPPSEKPDPRLALATATWRAPHWVGQAIPTHIEASDEQSKSVTIWRTKPKGVVVSEYARTQDEAEHCRPIRESKEFGESKHDPAFVEAASEDILPVLEVLARRQHPALDDNQIRERHGLEPAMPPKLPQFLADFLEEDGQGANGEMRNRRASALQREGHATEAAKSDGLESALPQKPSRFAATTQTEDAHDPRMRERETEGINFLPSGRHQPGADEMDDDEEPYSPPPAPAPAPTQTHPLPPKPSASFRGDGNVSYDRSLLSRGQQTAEDSAELEQHGERVIRLLYEEDPLEASSYGAPGAFPPRAAPGQDGESVSRQQQSEVSDDNSIWPPESFRGPDIISSRQQHHRDRGTGSRPRSSHYRQREKLPNQRPPAAYEEHIQSLTSLSEHGEAASRPQYPSHHPQVSRPGSSHDIADEFARHQHTISHDKYASLNLAHDQSRMAPAPSSPTGRGTTLSRPTSSHGDSQRQGPTTRSKTQRTNGLAEPSRSRGHRRNSSVEPPTHFERDQAQEDVLARLGVTGSAAPVFNMPGPARNKSASRSPHRSASPAKQMNEMAQAPPPPPPPPPPPAEELAWSHIINQVGTDPRPASRASNGTLVGSDFDGEDTPDTVKGPNKQPLTPIHESPEERGSARKRTRPDPSPERKRERRRQVDLTGPVKKRQPAVPAAYQRRW